jgi:hypothetical protein
MAHLTRLITTLGLFTLFASGYATGQSEHGRAGSVLQRKVARVQLAQESIFAALEQLSASADVPLSVERILPPRLNEVISDPVFTAKIEAATLEEVLNWATALDPRYTWLWKDDKPRFGSDARRSELRVQSRS